MKLALRTLTAFIILQLLIGAQLMAQDKTALNLDGINDYVSFSTTLANNSDQTIEFWLKLDAVPATGSKVLVYNGSTSANGYGLTLTDGKISLLIGGVALRNTTYNPVAGEWVHYALVRSSAANWTVYVNGNNYGNFTYSANAPTGFFKISQAGEQFAGSIDGLRVWKTARYATEISGSRYCWVNPFNTSITNDYYFSDGTIGGNNTLVTTLFDQAGSVNGTLQNFALTGATSNFAAGVFQFQTTGNLYVKANATGTNTGESWANAFTSLQTALDAAEGLSNCGIFNIWVAGGTYLPARDIFGQSNPADPRDKTFFLNSSTSVYGGFAGNETSLAQRTKAVIADNPTILSGDPGTPGSTTDNAYHVLLSVSGSDDGYSPVTDGFILSNGNASGTGGITSETGFFVSRGQGGAMYGIAAKRTFINCIFSNNSASGKGGGICSDNSIFSISSCIFSGNHSGGNGGGMYNTAATTAISIQNSSFTGNTAVNGGGFANEGTDAFSITNCLFWTNTGTGIGGAIYNTGQNNKITNSILYTNAGGSRLGATVNITYSIVEGELQAGEGNSNINPQFLNTGDPDGPDNEWMTADDGLQLSSCSPAIDKGTNNAVIGTTDITGQPRKNNVPFITDAGNGTAPLTDLGPYENQSNFTIAQISGSITGTHTIPYPQELTPDLLQSVSAPAAIPGLTISWEKNEENNGWVVTTPAAATAQYPLPELTKNTLFRRVVTVCGTTYYSNVVLIKVIKPNGAISGRVLSSNGTPVEGIKIYVQKKTSSLPGSPLNHRDSASTGADGSYTVSPLYYGDPDTIPAPATQFIVMPVKANHAFNFDTLTRSLTNIIPQVSNVDFIDKTVLSITGKTYQECVGCVNENGQPQTIVCPLDSVDMYKNDSYFTKTGQIEQGGKYGSYAATVTDPGTYKIEPRFKNHVFEPVFTNVAVTQNVADINFKDVSTHTISGKLTAGCNDYIGTAVLEFSDIIPNDADGNPRTGCFRKRVTTNPGSGTYSIVLPARKYAVRLISFTPKAGGNVNSPDLLAFFNTTVPKDSLVRDVTIANDSLDLIYQRAPVIQLIGLDNVCLAQPVPTNSFTVMQQGIEKTFTIKVYQGPVVNNFGCPVTDTTGMLFTNIQGDDINDTLIYRTTNGTAQLTLKGGIPNIVAPYYKTFFLQFKDVYGRTATASKNVVVKGIKTNTGTFTTVSPELPLMVLHDPPGDNSSSFWSTSSTAETALRFLAAENNNVNIWGEVKIGATFEAGIGVSTENSVWGSIKGTVDIGTRKNTNDETILTTTTTQNFSTASTDQVVGAKGDVFIGAALNLLYTIANEVRYTAPCSVEVIEKLIIANNGFATQYIYSENHIRNTIIPTLKGFITIPGVTPAQADSYRNQIRVWEQVLANNETNKRNAIFDKNLSFDGSAGPISSTTTTRSTKSSTIDFNLEITNDIAIELGLEIAGSGASGGVTIGMKMEMGNSTTNTTIKETTTGYTLDDDDNGDYFSVNIKKDPVYNTPVFEMVAATASCPAEQGSQPRDDMQLIVAVPSQTNIPSDGDAEFILKLSNTSQSQETRTYKLQFIQGSNPNGAIVTIGGSPAIIPITYTIGYPGEVQVVVKVKRGSANIYSYEGLQFMLSDNCDGGISKTASISAFFASSCSNISLSAPENNWVLNSYDNNLLQVLFKNYTIANLTGISLEYAKVGSGDWITGFTRTAAQLNNSINGTLVNWNIAGLNDGTYNLRLRLDCSQGTIYSERVTGIIDRQAPVKFGKPQPTDDRYESGDLVSISYNEKLDLFNLSNKVVVKRLSNNQLIDATVSGFDNQLVIVPSVPLSNFAGDSVRVIVQYMADQYGNIKSTADSFRFTIGNPVIATGPRTVTLGVINPVMAENGGGTIDVFFDLPVNASNDVRVNYAISGNATYPDDYSVQYTGTQALVNNFNGAQGTILIPKNSSRATLKIKPVGNSLLEPDKIIRISLVEGGDYTPGAGNVITGTILNDDVAAVYTFTGNGNFDVPGNWLNGQVPPGILLEGNEIIIDPAGTGACVLNVPLTIKPGAKLTVRANKKLQINGNLKLADTGSQQ